MIDLDELLQKNLAAIENGIPLERVVAELPPEAQELAPMLRLAAASRLLPYPEMHPDSVRAQRVRVAEAAVQPRKMWPSWLPRSKAASAVGVWAGLALVILL